jgi:hypothetical protein
MTDYRKGCSEFCGIFINAADTEPGLAEKRSRMYEAIAELMRKEMISPIMCSLRV